MAKIDKKTRQLLEEAGVLEQFEKETQDAVNGVSRNALQEEAYLHSEATLRLLEFPYLERKTKTCRHCNRTFLTSYHGVGYCGEACASKALERYGLDWSAKTLPERWGNYQPPFRVPPEALKAMKDLLLQSGLISEDQVNTSMVESLEQDSHLNDELDDLKTENDSQPGPPTKPPEEDIFSLISDLRR